MQSKAARSCCSARCFDAERCHNLLPFMNTEGTGHCAYLQSGEHRNEWSVSVSGNWRITFVDWDGGIERVNLEDYH